MSTPGGQGQRLYGGDEPGRRGACHRAGQRPGEQDPRFPFGSIHFGQLGFASNDQVVQETAHEGVYRGADDYAAIQAIEQAGVPLVLSVYLDRPAILTEVAPAARVLLANFGALDQALFDVASGAEGAASPFELPSSWQAVLAQSPDVAKDSTKPALSLRGRSGLLMDRDVLSLIKGAFGRLFH